MSRNDQVRCSVKRKLSPLLRLPVLATTSPSDATRSAWWRVAAGLVSLLEYSHPPPPPSKPSCVRQSPRSSSPPPKPGSGRTRENKVTHRHVLPNPALRRKRRDTDWFKTRIPDQTQKRPHLIQSVNRPSPSTLPQRTRITSPIFMSMGGPQAHA